LGLRLAPSYAASDTLSSYNARVARYITNAVREMFRGLGGALRSRARVFWLVSLAVFLLDIAAPPIVLSLFRKPLDYFTFNPWLVKLPAYLVSGEAPLAVRLEKSWNLALFWFSADSPYGVEWGFAVTVADLARFALMALIAGLYFAVWFYRRDRLTSAGWGVQASAQGGVLGAVSSVFGLATGGCTVMGCGAPILPVIGLAFVGLSSTTIAWLSALSTAATAAVIAGMGGGALYLAWGAGGAPSARRAASIAEPTRAHDPIPSR
jgi:hypothetical protein